jgi:hypothetical protein
VELTGELMKDQDECFKMYSRAGNIRAIGAFFYHRMCLAFLFDDIDLALSMSRKLCLHDDYRAPRSQRPIQFLARA